MNRYTCQQCIAPLLENIVHNIVIALAKTAVRSMHTECGQCNKSNMKHYTSSSNLGQIKYVFALFVYRLQTVVIYIIKYYKPTSNKFLVKLSTYG